MYADVNVHRPREYWDYESLTVTWGDQEEYEVRFSRGGGSQVGGGGWVGSPPLQLALSVTA